MWEKLYNAAVMPNGKVGSPCGACREYMMQLDKDSGNIEILLDLETKKNCSIKRITSRLVGNRTILTKLHFGIQFLVAILLVLVIVV